MAWLVLLYCQSVAFAQQTGGKSTVPISTPPLQLSQFGGPASVGAQLNHDHALHSRADFSGQPHTSRTHVEFKDHLRSEYGLALGLDYNALVEAASASAGENVAAGGVVRLFGTWTLTGAESEHTGALTFKVENRHRLGSAIAPQDLGGEIGYAGLTSVTFSDAGTLLTNLYWHQSLEDDRLAFVAGIVDVTDYVDVYGLGNPWTDFNNLAFSTNPTIPAPNQGLGAAVRLRFGDSYYALAGLADANGNPADPAGAVDSFFEVAEYFKHAEIGWVGSWQNRFTDNAHLTFWQADPRKQKGITGGWGMAASYSRRSGTWLAFLRAGYSHGGGALWDRSVSGGVGYFTGRSNDVLSLGVNWGRPSAETFGAGLDDQLTTEAFYRIHVLPHAAITPSAQLLINPAMTPDKAAVWVVGLRFRSSL